MRSVKWVLGVGALLFLLKLPLLSKKAIDFVLKDVNGNSVRLSDIFEDRIVLLDFWATWCLPCVKELRHIQKIHEKYRGKGVTVLSISVDGPDRTAQVKNFIRKYHYSFPVLLDSDSKVVSLYNPSLLLPYSVLLDRGGHIRYIQSGYSPGDESLLVEEIEKAFKDKKIVKKERLSYSLNENFLFRGFFDENYVNQTRHGRRYQILNQLDLTLSGKGYAVGLRSDSDLAFSPLQSQFSLAKRFVEFQWKSVYLRFGDFYSTIGRGLLFSLIKTFEREGMEHVVDTTVDGANIRYEKGAFSFDFMGGWVERQDSDKRDQVASASLAWKTGRSAEIRVNGLYADVTKGSLSEHRDVFMESISLDIPSLGDRFKFYGEFSLAQKQKFASDHFQNGFGVYLESGLYLGDLSFQLEFKNYRHLDFEYNRPPLVESEEIDILADALNYSAENIVGISGRVDYLWPSIELLIYGKMVLSEDTPSEDLIVGRAERKIFHAYGGIEKKFMNTGYWNILAGYREEKGAAPYVSLTHGRTFHYQLNLTYPVRPQWSIEADWKSKDFNGSFFEYFERRMFISAHWIRRGVLTLFYDRTTDPKTLAFKDKKDWFAVQLELKISPSKWIRLFIGSSKGSMKCSGGICRYFPPFEGIRAEAILRF